MGWLVQHQLLWKLNERDFMVPGGKERKKGRKKERERERERKLAFANNTIERVEQVNLL